MDVSDQRSSVGAVSIPAPSSDVYSAAASSVGLAPLPPADDAAPVYIRGHRVVWDLHHKPWLGGFRHTITGTEYHHACMQFGRPVLVRPQLPQVTRETQAAPTSEATAQTLREAGTQVPRPGVLDECPPGHKPRVLTSALGDYEPTEDYLKRQQAAAVSIQAGVRGMLARTAASTLRAELDEAAAEAAHAAAQASAEAERLRLAEIERRLHPRTAADFQVLYDELAQWVRQETAGVREAGLERDQEVAALAELLDMEASLLQTIDRLKADAAKLNETDRIERTLQRLAAPKRWLMSDGKPVWVETPYTARAAELAELYRGLQLKLPLDQRLDVLLHVKWACKEFDCSLTRDIVGLIDREADLINRSRPSAAIAPLRKRIAAMFLQLIETPSFNPESARLLSFPVELLNRPGTQGIDQAASAMDEYLGAFDAATGLGGTAAASTLPNGKPLVSRAAGGVPADADVTEGPGVGEEDESDEVTPDYLADARRLGYDLPTPAPDAALFTPQR
jgi:hypothetical protein